MEYDVSDVGAKLRSNNNNNDNNDDNDNNYSKATMSATTMTRAPSMVATTITTTTTATRERTTMFLSCQHSPLRRPLFLSFQIQINTKKTSSYPLQLSLVTLADIPLIFTFFVASYDVDHLFLMHFLFCKALKYDMKPEP